MSVKLNYEFLQKLLPDTCEVIQSFVKPEIKGLLT